VKRLILFLAFSLPIVVSGCGGGASVSFDQYGTNVGAASEVGSYQWDPAGFRSSR